MQREYFYFHQFTENLERLVNKADAIYFDLIAQRNPKARETIHSFLRKADHAFKIFDINIRKLSPAIDEIIIDSLNIADAFKLNLNEIKKLPRSKLRSFS